MELTDVTRQQLKQALMKIGGLSGSLQEQEFIESVWGPLATLPPSNEWHESFEVEFHRHRVVNSDWDERDLYARLDAFALPNPQFIAFLEKLVYPTVRIGAEQRRWVRVINSYLRCDGLALQSTSLISGHTCFKVVRVDDGPFDPTPDDDGFPFDREDYLCTMVKLLKDRGCQPEVGFLSVSAARLAQTGWEEGQDNPATTNWTLYLTVDAKLFARYENQIPPIQDNILAAGKRLLVAYPYDRLEAVCIAPKVKSEKDWRDAGVRFARGQGINNQARVRSDNLPTLTRDGLLFRSLPEVNLYTVLKSRGFVFAPLPVFLRGGEDYTRVEPDFIVLHQGIALVVEIDGDTFHSESPADAHERLLPFEHQGLRILRLRAKECQTLEKAHIAARKIVAMFDSIKASK